MVFPLNENELRKLKRVPQESNTWEALKVPARRIMQNPPRELADSDVVIWGDLSGESIRNMQFISSEDGGDLAQSLATAIMGVNRSIPPSRPTKIIIRDRRLMLFCRGMLRNLSIDCEFSNGASVFDQVIRELGSELAKFEPLSDEDFLPVEEQAAKLWDLAPWSFLKETEVIRLQFVDRTEAKELFAVTVGGGIGVHLGVLFFRDRQKIDRLFQSGSKMTVEEQAANFENCYSVTFDLDEPNDKIQGATGKDTPPKSPRLSIAVVDCEVDLRPLKDKFEIHTVQAAVTAYLQFVQTHRVALETGRYPIAAEEIFFDDPGLISRGLSHMMVSIDGSTVGLSDAELSAIQPESILECEELELTDRTIGKEVVVEEVEPRIIDLRAGKYSLTLEPISREFLENLVAKKAFFTPPLLPLLGKFVPALRLHLPKRRALNMVDTLSDLSLDELISLEMREIDGVQGPVLSLTDHLERVVVGEMKDSGVRPDELKSYLNIPSGGHRFVALIITCGSARPGVSSISNDNISGAFLCVADKESIGAQFSI